jgi:hypothetical protein
MIDFEVMDKYATDFALWFPGCHTFDIRRDNRLIITETRGIEQARGFPTVTFSYIGVQGYVQAHSTIKRQNKYNVTIEHVADYYALVLTYQFKMGTENSYRWQEQFKVIEKDGRIDVTMTQITDYMKHKFEEIKNE